MNTNGLERRKILQSGITAAEFGEMDEKGQNWQMYSDIHTLAAVMEEFIASATRRLLGLERAKKYAIRGLIGLGGVLTGLGALEHQTVLRWLAKLI